MNISEFKTEFPIFKRYPKLAYLDNAATTQKPQVVIDALTNFYTSQNANVHRGLYPLSEKATDAYELARKTVAKFIHAEPEEIVFTSGTTDSLNAVAHSLQLSKLLSDSPHILVTELEHHSNLLPWQRLANGNLEYIPVDANYNLDLTKYKQGNKQPELIAITHASNVTGTLNDIAQIRQQFPEAILVVDAAQTIGHLPVDVRQLGCDFLAFSGHKMYGPTGVGVLYINKKWHAKLEPFRVGGGMIAEVSPQSATWADAPEKYEAGTPPIAQAIGLAAAVNFIQNAGWENIQRHEQALRDELLSRLKVHIPAEHIYHSNSANQLGIVAFNIPGVHPHDAAYLLGDYDVAVRAGHHCTQILHREVLKASASLRASLGIYNTQADIDKFVDELKHVIDFKLQKHD